MDFNAIKIFLNEAFTNNIPTFVDINQIIDFYNKNILISNKLSISINELKDLSNKILNIKLNCKEVFILYELVLSGLIIHAGTLIDKEEFDNYYAQWVWSRWLLYKIELSNNLTIEEQNLLLMPNEIIKNMNEIMKQLYNTRYLFIKLWNNTIYNIIENRSNFEKTILDLNYNNTLSQNPLLKPYNSLPFWYTQPAFGLTYHNANNSTYFGLLGQFYNTLLKQAYPTEVINVDVSKTKTNRIKVGFISRTFNNHSIGRITMGLIEKLKEYDDIEIIVYTLSYHLNIHDQFAQRIYKAATEYKPILDKHFTDVIKEIRYDKLDVLIIPDTLTDIYSYCIGLYRLAPVQITTWGHPETSGSKNIDYYITSELFEKNIDNIYFEKPVLMKSLSFYYYDLQNTYGFDPIEMFKNSSRDELLKDLNLTIPVGAHIYGILSTMYKFHPSFDCIINAILHYDTKAYIILIRGVHEELFQKVLQRLNITINNENLNRILICPYQTLPYSYEKLMLSCDVILDTFPFGGCISTFDAFSCNKCVVTMTGNKLYSRFTQGLYKRMGFEDLIVKDEDAYVELAIKIATYPPIRRQLENKIATNKYKLYEDKEAINEWYNFIKNKCSNKNNISNLSMINFDINNLKQIFTDIYLNDGWNMGQYETRSGMGSTITYSENIRLELIKFIKENSIKKMLDTSCGDWNWMKLIQNDLCDYTGIDIVDEIIENNKQKFSNEKTHFIQGDLLTYIKSLPDKYYNLILCRHTLEHLPTNYNIDFLIECKRVSNYLLVTGYNNIDRINTDLVDDMRYRPINIELLPYSKILSQYYIKKIYDGPLNDYKEELYIYLYNFS